MLEYLKREFQGEDEGNEWVFVKEKSITEKYQTNKKTTHVQFHPLL